VNEPIDLRSDTVTKPTEAMRRAIAEAEVGDDVHGDDPTVNRLQDRVAEMFGKDRAVFVPSGSMANSTSIRAHTQPGDEIIAHVDSHIYQYEAGSFAALSGCSMHMLRGPRGRFEVGDLESAVRADDPHFPRSRLLVIENTHNKGGGSIWPIEEVERLGAKARELHLRTHLDGARLMNACVALGCDPIEYTRHFDTVSMCFSKGLGAPVGSIVAGDHETMRRVRRFRTMFGGAMRQAGLLAAGALYAIDHHVERLAEDHANARRLAEALAELPGVSINPESVETNIIYFDVDPALGSAEAVAKRLDAAGARMLDVGPRTIRALTHLDAAGERIDRAIAMLGRELGG